MSFVPPCTSTCIFAEEFVMGSIISANAGSHANAAPSRHQVSAPQYLPAAPPPTHHAKTNKVANKIADIYLIIVITP
jgi:hypothetical protein